jgi:hypothetical protein
MTPANALQIEDRVDELRSPWLWLVKWFQAIPHSVVVMPRSVAVVVPTRPITQSLGCPRRLRPR